MCVCVCACVCVYMYYCITFTDHWSLLHSAILRSQAASPCSCHVILNEWLHQFYSKYFWYLPKWCADGAIWLLHGWCHVKLLPSWCKFMRWRASVFGDRPRSQSVSCVDSLTVLACGCWTILSLNHSVWDFHSLINRPTTHTVFLLFFRVGWERRGGGWSICFRTVTKI